MRADNSRFYFLVASFSILVLLSACDRMVTSRNTRLVKEADWKAAQGDYLWAINLYEAALDGTPQSAEVHFKLALLYDDKMNDPCTHFIISNVTWCSIQTGRTRSRSRIS